MLYSLFAFMLRIFIPFILYKRKLYFCEMNTG